MWAGSPARPARAAHRESGRSWACWVRSSVPISWGLWAPDPLTRQHPGCLLSGPFGLFVDSPVHRGAHLSMSPRYLGRPCQLERSLASSAPGAWSEAEVSPPPPPAPCLPPHRGCSEVSHQPSQREGGSPGSEASQRPPGSLGVPTLPGLGGHLQDGQGGEAGGPLANPPLFSQGCAPWWLQGPATVLPRLPRVPRTAPG